MFRYQFWGITSKVYDPFIFFTGAEGDKMIGPGTMARLAAKRLLLRAGGI
jgi:hypothetical protein